MATRATQTGPRLTITGTCEGCCHLTRRTIRNDSLRWIVQTCAHPDFPRGYWIARIKEKPVPPDDGCPELSAARLALARSVVAAEAPCQVSLVRQIGGNLPCVRKGEHAEHQSACGRRWGGEDFTDHPDFDSRAFCDDGSEAQ